MLTPAFPVCSRADPYTQTCRTFSFPLHNSHQGLILGERILIFDAFPLPKLFSLSCVLAFLKECFKSPFSHQSWLSWVSS